MGSCLLVKESNGTSYSNAKLINFS